MSNLVEYKDAMAFHPGYYIAETIEDMGVKQEEFAQRMGTTSKTLSNLVNGEINISLDLAEKLASMLGTSVELWLNLQTAYEREKAKIDSRKGIDDQVPIARQIDYKYFVDNTGLTQTRSWPEKIKELCSYLKIFNLNLLKEQDFLVNYRTGIADTNEKNAINARVWIQIAINHASLDEVRPFDGKKLKSYLEEMRGMTLQPPEVFAPRLSQILSECGVVFVYLPYLKNSGINGAVKWLDTEHVMLAMNNRKKDADVFWFSFFHEIKHVLQKKRKTVFLSYDKKQMKERNEQMEDEADAFAMKTLIPNKEFASFINEYESEITQQSIIAFSAQIKVHPGIVVGRLQHENIIKPTRFNDLKTQYKITREK